MNTTFRRYGVRGHRQNIRMIWYGGSVSSDPERERTVAGDIVLTPDDLAEIDRALPPGAASGTRYPIGQMHRLNR